MLEKHTQSTISKLGPNQGKGDFTFAPDGPLLNCLVQHQAWAIDSSNEYASLFHEQQSSQSLWLQLLKKGRSIRKLSPAFRRDLQKLFSLRKDHGNLLEKKIPRRNWDFYYSMADYRFLNSQTTTPPPAANTYQQAKLSIRLGLELEPQDKRFTAQEQLALCTLKRVQQSRGTPSTPLENSDFNLWIDETIAQVFGNMGSTQRDLLLSMSTINSLNFLNFSLKRIQKARVVSKKIQTKLLPKILDPDIRAHCSAIAYHHIAQCEVKIEDKIALLKKAFAMDSFYGFSFEIARHLKTQGRLDEAKHWCETALPLSPFPADLMVFYGQILEEFSSKKEELLSWFAALKILHPEVTVSDEL